MRLWVTLLMLSLVSWLPFDVASAAHITEVMNETSDPRGFPFAARALAVDAIGNVYAANTSFAAVFKLTPGGDISVILDANGDGAGNRFGDALDIAVDPIGNVYVVSGAGGGSNVFKITPDGIVSVIIDATGDGEGNRLDSPTDIAVDTSGNVYVTGMATANSLHTAFRITPDGAIARIIDIAIGLPRDIAVDADGNVFVAVSGDFSDGIHKITPNGIITKIIDFDGDGAGNLFSHPTGIAVDAGGNVYSTSVGVVLGGGSVFRITPDGIISVIIDAAGDGAGNRLLGAEDVAVDAFGNVYVTGRSSNNVFQIAPDGSITEIVDETGDGAGASLAFPTSRIEVDATGNVFFLSGGNVFRVGTEDAPPDSPIGELELTVSSLGNASEQLRIDLTVENSSTDADGSSAAARVYGDIAIQVGCSNIECSDSLPPGQFPIFVQCISPVEGAICVIDSAAPANPVIRIKLPNGGVGVPAGSSLALASLVFDVTSATASIMRAAGGSIQLDDQTGDLQEMADLVPGVIDILGRGASSQALYTLRAEQQLGGTGRWTITLSVENQSSDRHGLLVDALLTGEGRLRFACASSDCDQNQSGSDVATIESCIELLGPSGELPTFQCDMDSTDPSGKSVLIRFNTFPSEGLHLEAGETRDLVALTVNRFGDLAGLSDTYTRADNGQVQSREGLTTAAGEITPGVLRHFVELTVVYVNGVLNTRAEAEFSTVFLANQARRSIDPELLNNVEFTLAYNQTQGLRDFLESLNQIADEPEIVLNQILGPFASRPTNSALEQLLLQAWGRAVSALPNPSARQRTLDSQLSHYDQALSEPTSRMIIMSHSQGNLFANEGFHALTTDQQLRTRVISVASPASGPADPNALGTITLTQDLVIRFVPGAADALFTNDPAHLDADWRGHSFVDVYLRTGSNSEAAIINDLREHLRSPGSEQSSP